MFNSPVLDLVILLSFTYFMGSLISALMKARAKDLKKTLENLLLDPNWTVFAQKELFTSQHIKSLMNNSKQFPSYIPAQNFMLFIIEVLNKTGIFTPDSVGAAITASALPASMKGVLNDLLAKAQANVSATKNELSSFEQELEVFYNNAMERATGWYKRKVRRIMLVAGFVVAAVLNIDTIKISNDALSDKAKLAKTVDKIIETLPDNKGAKSISISTSADTSGISITEVLRIDSLINGTLTNIKNLQIKYNQVGGYQLGYNKGEFKNEWWPDKNGIGVFLLKIIGLLFTAFALQLGSNYWFDLLNKVVNLRATGMKPDQKPKATK
jgi:hypothetical protein